MRARVILEQYVEGANGEPADRRLVVAADRRLQQRCLCLMRARSSRMRKKSASGVLASLRGSTRVFGRRNHWRGFSVRQDRSHGRTAPRSAVRTSSPLRSLRPCPRNGASWRAGVGRVRSLAFLRILLAILTRDGPSAKRDVERNN